MADIEEEVKEQKLAEIMQEALMKNSYVKFLGIEFMEFRCKHTVARIPYKEQLLNPYGMLHGGSLYSAADIVAGAAACLGGHYVTTVSGSLNFMLPADHTEYVCCEADQLRLGKHLAVYEVKLKNDQGTVLDSGEFTFFITEHDVV